jgi:ketosteroid isomerase-like protein
MAQGNAEIVRELSDCWRRRDFDAAMRLIDPDAEFDWTSSRAPYAGLYRGHAQVTEIWQALTDAWEEFYPEVEEAIEVDHETVVIVTRVRARGKGSGVPVRAKGASMWVLRDGLVVRAKLFQSASEAFAATGLPKPAS